MNASRSLPGRVGVASAVLLAVLVARPTGAGAYPPAGPSQKAAGKDRPFWTTSKVKGTPESPPPYRVEVVYPKLSFDFPVVIAKQPDAARWWVGELPGKIVSFKDDPNVSKSDLALDVKTIHPDMTMYYGLAFHPRFSENRYIYVCYVLKNDLPDGSVVSRFTVTRDDPPRIDPRSEKKIFSWWSGGHNGACLYFGLDGYLYISTGDGAGPYPPDGLKTGQDISDYTSSVLRIDVDHEDNGRAYRVPPDNPFLSVPNAKPEIWAFGFRNPWKMSIDRESGDLWVGDVGWELWELIYRVERGGNYGWSVVEGRQPVLTELPRGQSPISPPIVDHSHSEASSITGGNVYRGKKHKDLFGEYIYGDYQTGRMWGLRYDSKARKLISHRELAFTPIHLVSFGEDTDGELLLLDHDRTKQIYKLVPEAAPTNATPFPQKLSETGLFSSVKDHRVESGVLPYDINARMWADHATAERYLAIPGSAQIDVDFRGGWKFPEGTVLMKTVSIETEAGNPKSRKRIETQILHQEEESWRPYSFMWNEDQTDATLVDASGSSKSLTVADKRAPGGVREQTYRFFGRLECLLCHNPWVEKKTTIFGRPSASPIGIDAKQLDRASSPETRGDQLAEFKELGLFSKPPAPVRGRAATLVDPYDESADRELRARSYLHVNCSHCHQFGGGGSAKIQLQLETSLDKMVAIDERPIQGAFGISGARVIAPGDPEGSVMYYRVSKTGSGHMPRLGANLVDERWTKLLREWIASMPHPGAADSSARLSALEVAALRSLRNPSTLPAARAEAMRRLTETTRGALALTGPLADAENALELRKEAGQVAKSNPKSEIRDLFERFLPESQRVKRLGDVINPAEILAIQGDPIAGRLLFATDATMQCRNCHRIESVGQAVGPDLDKIASKYTKPEILNQILDPSRAVDPQYVSYVLETKTGLIHTGLLVKKDAKEVVLKDAGNKTITVPSEEVEILAQQPKSLMPELQLKEMTAKQVADLLEYLSSRK